MYVFAIFHNFFPDSVMSLLLNFDSSLLPILPKEKWHLSNIQIYIMLYLFTVYRVNLFWQQVNKMSGQIPNWNHTHMYKI